MNLTRKQTVNARAAASPSRSMRGGPRARSAFSLVEMLIALAISAALLTATLAALNSSMQHYQSTTESASTHVVSRIVMHRILSMVRTGTDFGPIPADVLDPAQNPVRGNTIEFVSQRDIDGGIDRVTRLEFRPGAMGAAGELWYVLLQPADPPVILEERPLLPGVAAAEFALHFSEDTWLLDRAQIDLTIQPNDSEDLTIEAGALPETIRLVASAAPRQTQ